MQNIKIGGIAIIGLLVGIVIIGMFFYRLTIQSQANRLLNGYEAQVENQSIFHDQMWKEIAQIAQVDVKNDEMQREFFDAWENAISGTGAMNTNSTFPIMFQQAGITLSTEMKQRLAQTISDRQFEFTTARRNLVSACTAYNTYVQDPWYSVFLGDYPAVDCRVITSNRTNHAAETGIDDEVNIY